MVSDTKGEVVGRSFEAPASQKRADIGEELAVRVRVAGGGNWAGKGFALGDDKLEFSVSLNPDAE